MNKRSPQTIEAKPKRRFLRVGPGLILALALSAVVGYGWIKSEIEARKSSGVLPIVERQIITSAFEESLGPTPDAKFLIARADKLHLTADQVSKLAQLQTQWAKTYAPKLAQANSAVAKAQDYLDKAKSNRRTPVAQIENEAGQVIGLSRELASARRDYWRRAMAILTADQRKMADTERKADWSAKMKKLKSAVLGK